MSTTKFLMQGVVVSSGRLISWISDAPDWAGAFAEDFDYIVPVTDVAIAGGGFESVVTLAPYQLTIMGSGVTAAGAPVTMSPFPVTILGVPVTIAGSPATIAF